jgi:hypothetical protein
LPPASTAALAAASSLPSFGHADLHAGALGLLRPLLATQRVSEKRREKERRRGSERERSSQL